MPEFEPKSREKKKSDIADSCFLGFYHYSKDGFSDNVGFMGQFWVDPKYKWVGLD